MNIPETHQQHPIKVLFADDDIDDRFFFDEGLSTLPIPTILTIVEDGAKLMEYLNKHAYELPDIIFLDLNMPKKNGLECLMEMKINEKLNQIPVIIYSTSTGHDFANLLYDNGAYYYVKKTDSLELQKILHHVLSLLLQNNFSQPDRTEFILSLNPGEINNNKQFQ